MPKSDVPVLPKEQVLLGRALKHNRNTNQKILPAHISISIEDHETMPSNWNKK